nr:hypothetical protein [uncultured Pedobacter sp.]
MKYLIILTTALLSIWGKVQAQNNADTTNANRAKMVIADVFHACLDSASYLLYNLDDKYIVVQKKEKKYVLFFIKDHQIEDSLWIGKRNKTLKKAFDQYSCTPVNTADTSSAHPHSRYIYFFLKKGGNTYCEFNMPALFSTDVKDKQVYPLDDDVHEFLIKKMFTHWKY